MDLKKKVLVVLDRQEKSLSDLAGLLKMTPQSLNTIFVKGNPRKSTVEKIAAALKVSPDFLMAEISESETSKPKPAGKINTEPFQFTRA